MTVATFNDRLYGVPLYADVSALFYNKDLFEQAGLDPNKPPTSLAELREYADQDHARSAVTSRATTCRATAPAATSSRSAR